MDRKLGVIVNSDHESTHQSYASVWAPEFTSEVAHAALKRRLSFGATDNIIGQFEAVESGGKVHKRGSEIKVAESPEFRVRLSGTDEWREVELIRNGKVLLHREPAARNDEFSFRDNEPLDSEAYYQVRGVQENGQMVWPSPIWVLPQSSQSR